MYLSEPIIKPTPLEPSKPVVTPPKETLRTSHVKIGRTMDLIAKKVAQA